MAIENYTRRLMAIVRDLGFGPTGSSAIQSADLENSTLSTLEPKTKRIG